MKTTLLVFAEFCHVAWGSLPWPTLTNYGRAVSAYWWVLLAGMAVLFVDGLKWKRCPPTGGSYWRAWPCCLLTGSSGKGGNPKFQCG